MNNLIKVVDNTSETLDEQLFGQFMKRSQYGTTQVLVKRNKQNDKQKLIRQVYFDMKARSSSEFESICCLFCV